MRPLTLILTAVIGALMWLLLIAAIGIALDAARAGTTSRTPSVAKLAPPVACTMANRLDIFVDEDNIMWACECEALKSGHICRWQVIGGVDPVSVRRSKRHARHGTINPVLSAVTA